MVYFITDGTYTKIGKADDPDKRLKELQTSNPLELKLWTVYMGGIELEKKLHKIFNFYRFSGEWFLLPKWHLDNPMSEEDIDDLYKSIKSAKTCKEENYKKSKLIYKSRVDSLINICNIRIAYNNLKTPTQSMIAKYTLLSLSTVKRHWKKLNK